MCKPAGRPVAVLAGVIGLLLTVAATAFAQAGESWRDQSLSPDQRARALVDAMTLDQKVTLFAPDPGEPIPELGIPPRRESDGCCGVNTSATPTTSFPAGLSTAATFDQSLATEWGDGIGLEARLTGQSGITSPSLDLMRNPTNGRGWESFGEDPLLQGRMGAGTIRGVQRNNVYSLAKHYTLNDQETKRGSVDEQVDERTLNELYVRPWEIVAAQQPPGAVMCAFPNVNGTKACSNQHLLSEILKGRLGFKGFVSSDYNACPGVESFLAGTDVCGPAGGPFSGADLKALVQSGQLPVSRFDDMVFRVLRSFFAVGLYDNPPPGAFTGEQNQTLPEAVLDRDEDIARRVAREGTVLLKNDRGALPLSSAGLDSVAVIGSDADWRIDGGGASSVPSPSPGHVTTILDGIRQRAGNGVDVTYARGTDPVRMGDTIPGLMEPVPSDVLTPAGGATGAHGMFAEYFDNPAFGGAPFLARVEDQVNQRSGLSADLLGTQQTPGLPFALLFNPAQSRRYTGTLTPTQTGDYTLAMSHLGTVRLFVNGDELIDDPGTQDTTSTATLPLVAGRPYAIRIEYVPDAPNTFAGSLNDAPFPMIRFDWTPPSDAAVPGIQQAAEAAAGADVAVVVARDYIGEQADRGTLRLGQSQDRLIRAVAAANPRTIVVLATSGPVLMPWLRDVAAVLEAWYPGEAQGAAVADLLFGDHSPSGKLPVTFPATDEQPEQIGIPIPFRQITNASPTAAHDEGVFVGYRGYEQHNVKPLFPFGHGLSYTTFDLSDLQLENPRVDQSGGPVRNGQVRVLVSNTGERAGTETVQVYSGRLPTGVATPPKQLIGWGRVTLGPGGERYVTVPIDIAGSEHPLAYFDPGSERWVTPTGDVAIYVGSSSSDIRQTGTMTVERQAPATQPTTPGGAPGAPPAPGGTPPATRPGNVTVGSRRVRATRSRVVKVRLRCPRSIGASRCRGVLTATRGKAGDRQRIAHTRISIPAGRTTTVKLTLTRSAYRTLTRRRAISVRLALQIRRADGTVQRTTRWIRVLAPARR
jgi:beta-glucosidase